MEKSSGAVIYNSGKYLLLKYDLGHWGFVKGHIEKNETEMDTLYREAYEETGLSKKNLEIKKGFKEKISYNFKKNNKSIYKEVVFFFLKSSTYEITLSNEHKNYLWLSYKNAYEKLTFENSKKVLEKANKFIKK